MCSILCMIITCWIVSTLKNDELCRTNYLQLAGGWQLFYVCLFRFVCVVCVFCFLSNSWDPGYASSNVFVFFCGFVFRVFRVLIFCYWLGLVLYKFRFTGQICIFCTLMVFWQVCMFSVDAVIYVDVWLSIFRITETAFLWIFTLYATYYRFTSNWVRSSTVNVQIV